MEKSLDSYKFNLLHCKQTFISQLKSGAMEARTIDEGAMDEKSGMNFSEYMALLSGNTDLLDKAKLEKRIASLEGEHSRCAPNIRMRAVSNPCCASILKNPSICLSVRSEEHTSELQSH